MHVLVTRSMINVRFHSVHIVHTSRVIEVELSGQFANVFCDSTAE